MTDEQKELAFELMRAAPEVRRALDRSDVRTVTLPRPDYTPPGAKSFEGPLLTDDATGGVLLGMLPLREGLVWGVSRQSMDLNPFQVRIYRGEEDPLYFNGDTLAEACAKALLAVRDGT